MEGPFIDIVDGKIKVQIELSQLEIKTNMGVHIPKLSSSSAIMEKNTAKGGTTVKIALSSDDIKSVKEITTERSFVLPDRRPIPGFSGGKLQNGLRLDLKPVNNSLSFYYHEKVFGFVIPLNANYSFATTSKAIELNWKGKGVGSLHLIGAEDSKKPMVLVFLRLKEIEENTDLMDKLTKKAD